MNLFSKRKTRKNPHGFVVLNIALIVGAIGILVALGIVSATMFQTQTISSRQDALLAQTNAETCIEKAIYELTKDIHLYGSYVYYLDNGGKCEYFYISGTGNTNRVIQSRAVVGTSTRLKEARIIQVRPVLRLAYVKDISTLSEIEVVRGENLALWLSAQDTSALSLSGETMRTWLDKSLLKNNVSQDQKEKQPTYVSRIDNRPGVFFNGTNNLLEGQDSLSLRISGEISLSAWVRINPTNESSHKIIQKNHPSGHSEHSSYALAITRSVENYRVDLHTQSCDGLALKAEGPIIQGNKWVHVLVTYSEVEELAKFYVNGGLATEVAHSGLICDGVGGTVEIGSNSTNNEWFDGYIDDIRLYNRAVNSDDVFKIYMQTIPSHILTVALSNLSLWFDPSEYETLTIESNDKVSSWKDRIRDTVFLSQNADSNRPLYTQSVGGKEGLDFDGTQTYLSMPTDPSIELTDEITISAWIRPRQGGGNSKLVHKKSTTNSTTNSLYALILEEDNSVAFRTFDCPGNTNTFVGPEIPINKWSHVTATYSNTLDTVRIFLDGKLTHFNANYTGEICNEEGNFEIGGFSNHAIDKWFDGFIGEIRLYDAALSDQHIRAIYDETFRQLNIPANWYDSSWSHRNVITIDSNQVVEDLTNFPVLINSTREEWKHAGSGGNVGKSDGTDILFTSEDGQTKLDHEIEKFDGVTGELVAWVRAPFLPGSVDTEIYMYYGNVDAENQQNAAGVWDSNYVGVWHLKENPAGTAPQMLDSTTNVNHGTSGGSMTSGDQIAGKIGGSLNFDGTNDVIRVPNSPSTDITGNQFTLSAWVYPTDIGCGNSSCDEGIISKAHEGTSNAERYHLGLNRTGSISVRRFSGTQNFGPSTADVVVNNGWQYLVGRYDGSTLKAYYNGNEVGSTGASGNIDSSVEDLLFGKRYDNRFHTGRIDEIRVSNVARSAGWITTEYNNQNSPGTFYSVSVAENIIGASDPSTPANWYSDSWSHRNTITVSSGQVVEDLTNFPVLINSTREEWKHTGSGGNVGKSDGTDILFTSEDGLTKLDHEIEQYDPSTGKLVAWIRAPSLTSSVDTDLFIYYGNGTAADQQNVTGVWDSNYVGVWHLSEQGDGTAGEFKDSTANANHAQGGRGSLVKTPTRVDGPIGFAQRFVYADQTVIETPHSSSLSMNSAHTLQAWVLRSAWNEGWQSIVGKGDDTYQFRRNYWNDNLSYDIRGGTGGIVALTSTGDLSANQFRLIHATYDGSTMRFFFDGFSTGNTGRSGTMGTNSQGVQIGANADSNDNLRRWWSGDITEVRISNVARSAGWITTEYNNQNSPGTFYSLETEESL